MKSANQAPKALILGGNGFIGRHISKQLCDSVWRVTVGTRYPHRDVHPLLDSNTATLGVRFELLLEPENWLERIAEFDLVVNAVGILRQRGAESYDRVHHRAPHALALACAQKNIPLIHISALGLRNPVRSRFLLSKLRGEITLLKTAAKVYIVRPSLLDGEQGFGAAWVRRVAHWPVQFYPRNGIGKIASCKVEELAEAIAILAKKIHSQEKNLPVIFELGGEVEETIAQHLGRRFQQRSGFRPWQIPIPAFVARIAAHLFDLVHFSPYSFGHYELLRFDNCPKPNRMAQLLGRRPIDPSAQAIQLTSAGVRSANVLTGKEIRM